MDLGHGGSREKFPWFIYPGENGNQNTQKKEGVRRKNKNA